MFFDAPDMTGHRVQLNAPPQRIVSLVPSQTELLFDLGLGDEVVGITKFCVHPENWFRSKARVGGTKNVHIDRLAALKPDLVLANKEENVREQIEAIRNICPVWTSEITNLDDAYTMIRSIGTLVSQNNAAAEIVSTIQTGFAGLATGQPQRVLYLIWYDPWMSAGSDTFIHSMIEQNGWTNVMEESLRYPTLDDDAIRNSGANIVLLSSEPYPFKEKHAQIIQALLPDARILFVDGEMFSWYGSRLALAPAYFQNLLK